MCCGTGEHVGNVRPDGQGEGERKRAYAGSNKGRAPGARCASSNGARSLVAIGHGHVMYAYPVFHACVHQWLCPTGNYPLQVLAAT